MAKKKTNVPVLPEGFFDIVPEDQKYWHYVWRKTNSLLADYSFNRLDLAPVEHAEVFTRLLQASTSDVARKLIVGRTKDGTQLALRANMAASIMRVYLQRGMHALPHPVKMFTSAPIVTPSDTGHVMHHQLGVQTIGDNTEAVDAELLFLGCRIMEAFALGSFTVRLNTVGDVAGRPAYLRALRDFFKTHQKKLSARTQAALKEHPFKGVIALAQDDPGLAKEMPQSVDYLSEEARLHFKRLLEFLDEGQVPYVIDPTLVCAEDYATHTVWEFVLDDGMSVLTGGRYDRLAELLGGPATPVVGWVLDVDGVVNYLKHKDVIISDGGPRPKVFLSQLGEAAKRRSLMLFEEIRKSGIEVRYSLSRDTIKGQLRMAARYGVRFALIFGQKEALEGTVILREMETGIQETIPLEKIIGELKKRLRVKLA